MANQYANKIVYGNTVLIDLTADTVTADKILASYTAHDASGVTITGTCKYDVNSQDATVKVAEILSGQTAYARGTKLTGTMPNNGAVNLTISMLDDEVAIAQGYHDGSGKVSILDTEKAKLIASNIKQGITILGVTGTLEPSSEVKVHSKSATPKTTAQTILPDTGYDYLAQVSIAAIPYVETDNSAGGKTVTIAGEG
jgi:hypothetical protein